MNKITVIPTNDTKRKSCPLCGVVGLEPILVRGEPFGNTIVYDRRDGYADGSPRLCTFGQFNESSEYFTLTHLRHGIEEGRRHTLLMR